MTGKTLKFWGWGYQGEGATPAERRALADTYGRLLGLRDFPDPPPPVPGDFALPKPRIAPPPRLKRLFRADAETRLIHALGKSFPDAVRMADRKLGAVPDLVAFPETERDIAAILDWAAGRRIAVIPFGGGTSVVGGVEAAVGDRFRGVVTLSTVKLARVREIDPVSRAALIEGGIRGPALEAALAPHGLTLRHFPQSFEMATLGGWIATRSGGHYATLYTHIDDFVESLRLATPAGISESRRLPGSGAGPSPDRLVIGSEGALGIVTAAWMRLQHRPRFRANAAATFASFLQGAEAVRAIAQSGLNPANCRLVDADECRVNGVSDDGRHLLVLGFESAHVDVAPAMARAVELARAAGGTVDAAGHTEGAVGRWRNAFLRMPYFREITVNWAVINDTFETAIPWNRFPDFHAAVMDATRRAIQAATGAPGLVTCRFTHVYPDGPAPYFSFHAKGDRRRLLAQWRRIKKAASDAVIAHGGTITHHHAVGRDHMPWYERQRPRLFGAALAAAKRALDPAGIMNPGVIVR